jgi:CheY-like chemotaxis protein
MRKIILAEDDPAIQDTMQMILEMDGCEVTIYPNGQELLSNDFKLPDMFILDRQLSGADGLDICRHLKHQPITQHIPVIILSANPQAEGLAKAAGAEDFLEKPFKMESLRQMVAKYVGK